MSRVSRAWPRLGWGSEAVFRRNFLMWRNTALTTVLGDVLDPIGALLALGFGLGVLLPQHRGRVLHHVPGSGLGVHRHGLWRDVRGKLKRLLAFANSVHLRRDVEHAVVAGQLGVGGELVRRPRR